jgi:hypothetical protein
MYMLILSVPRIARMPSTPYRLSLCHMRIISLDIFASLKTLSVSNAPLVVQRGYQCLLGSLEPGVCH